LKRRAESLPHGCAETGALQDAGARFSGSRERKASWIAAALRRFNLERNRASETLS